MIGFVAVGALMALIAIALVVYPLLKPMPAEAQGEPAAKAAPVALALAVAIGLGAFGVYAKVNNFSWDNPVAAQPLPQGHDAPGTGGSMDQVTAALEARLRQEPNDLEGWRMLGRTYLVSGNAAKAAAAYEQANSLSPQKDMALLLDLAEALILAGDATALPRATAIVDEALAADPANQKGLWYQGVMAVRAGDNETAKRNWTKLLEANPPPEIRDLIASQLRELGVDVPGGDVAVKGRTIRLNISLDPALAARLQPGMPLFVAAREPGIPGPPIAAIRIMSDDLPAQVVLSDANTMIAGRDLSSVNDVEIVARVAFGGTVVTASGDLVGRAVQKRGGGENLDVVIDQVQP